ncbi:aldo/keto reductase [Heliophilum fasciatum]|uniref:Aldo/keto reductase family protein n=1 Tax=Heliophilum fasciatum TaxID=35700 RepID=A0A4R2RX45_9FIRM|nr:aldo/keto reductase [Heliophilum fasciatum]MCW2278396.1 aryl-alcohol dehydrogenase-like predicted oxidoreductase [Heliophilum fasciatum]TCP63705.1 aldo/keto reductase family protein [Heliophilum fasciatum]
MLQGATVNSTTGYAKRYPKLMYNTLGQTGLKVSQAGFGAYRIHNGSIQHRQALRHALLSGINLIDTSANYADGRSEALIGEVLTELIGTGELRRDELVLVTKAGYIQGANYAISQERRRRGQPFPERVIMEPGFEHCIHRDFLADQLTRSLQRLQVATVDVFLLHNPEYYLKHAQEEGVPLATARQEYLRRIEAAFRYLETQVEAGRIGAYGISSNTFPVAKERFDHMPFADIVAIAKAIKEDHHFQVIELPLNLLETGAMTESNQPGGCTVVELARQLNVAVLVNRPLNAIVNNRLIRLADVTVEATVSWEAVEKYKKDLKLMEEQLKKTILVAHPLAKSNADEMAMKLCASEILEYQLPQFASPLEWNEAVGRYFGPTIQAGIEGLLGHKRHRQRVDILAWAKQYAETVNDALDAVSFYLQAKAADAAIRIKACTEQADPDWTGTATLSQAALRALRSTEGITTVLLGMRQLSYVDDGLIELSRPVQVLDRAHSWLHLAQAKV